MTIINFIVIFLVVIVIITTLVFYMINGIAPTPSSMKAKMALLKYLPEKIEGDIVDAGAGFGGIALLLASQYPKNKVISWENAWVPFIVLKLRAYFSYKNIEVRYGNFTNQSLSKVSVVYVFLCRKGMKTVSRWLAGNPCARLLLVSNAFQLQDKKPMRSIAFGCAQTDKLYLYVFNREPFSLK